MDCLAHFQSSESKPGLHIVFSVLVLAPSRGLWFVFNPRAVVITERRQTSYCSAASYPLMSSHDKGGKNVATRSHLAHPELVILSSCQLNFLLFFRSILSVPSVASF
jgi:hypothetical protein